MIRRVLSSLLITTFFLFSLTLTPKAQAQELNLPLPGTMINLSPAFEPILIKGLTVNKENPFLFNFIVDTGNDVGAINNRPYLQNESDRLIKYFFACLTIPEKDLWVNLSPYEKDRMIPKALGETALGRDLLAQDYVLKQLTASLMYPEKGLGKEFWDRVYAKAQEQFGTTEIPVNTFNKIWILADKATVYEHNQTAFVVDGRLKVMLEEDYLALERNKHGAGPAAAAPRPASLSLQAAKVSAPASPATLASNIVREIIIPELEKEVNTGRNFTQLRQVFNSLILATWYKKNLKEALLTQVYADKSTVNGVELKDTSDKNKIYQQYLQAYKKGVFNFIKETDVAGQLVPRKYFSGGFNSDLAMTTVKDLAMAPNVANPVGRFFNIANLAQTSDAAMIQSPPVSDRAMKTDNKTPFQRFAFAFNRFINSADTFDREKLLLIFKRISERDKKLYRTQDELDLAKSKLWKVIEAEMGSKSSLKWEALSLLIGNIIFELPTKAPEDKVTLETDIRHLNFTPRTKGALMLNRVHRVAGILIRDEHELRSIGSKYLKEIRERLLEYGFYLKGKYKGLVRYDLREFDEVIEDLSWRKASVISRQPTGYIVSDEDGEGIRLVSPDNVKPIDQALGFDKFINSLNFSWMDNIVDRERKVQFIGATERGENNHEAVFEVKSTMWSETLSPVFLCKIQVKPIVRREHLLMSIKIGEDVGQGMDEGATNDSRSYRGRYWYNTATRLEELSNPNTVYDEKDWQTTTEDPNFPMDSPSNYLLKREKQEYVFEQILKKIQESSDIKPGSEIVFGQKAMELFDRNLTVNIFAARDMDFSTSREESVKFLLSTTSEPYMMRAIKDAGFIPHIEFVGTELVIKVIKGEGNDGAMTALNSVEIGRAGDGIEISGGYGTRAKIFANRNGELFINRFDNTPPEKLNILSMRPDESFWVVNKEFIFILGHGELHLYYYDWQNILHSIPWGKMTERMKQVSGVEFDMKLNQIRVRTTDMNVFKLSSEELFQTVRFATNRPGLDDDNGDMEEPEEAPDSYFVDGLTLNKRKLDSLRDRLLMVDNEMRRKLLLKLGNTKQSRLDPNAGAQITVEGAQLGLWDSYGNLWSFDHSKQAQLFEFIVNPDGSLKDLNDLRVGVSAPKSVKLHWLKPKADPAAIANIPGGIDLNSINMGMTVTKDTNGGVKVDFDSMMIERIRREGVSRIVPVIIQMTPMTSVDIQALIS